MTNTSSPRPSRPPSVKDLVAQAENFSFNTNIPLKYWLRTAETLQQEADFALSDDDYGRAYIMLYRHSTLVLKCIPTHPGYKDAENRAAYKKVAKRMNRVIQDLEQIKPEIDNARLEWDRMVPPVKIAEPTIRVVAAEPYAQFAVRDPSLAGNTKILDAAQNQELAVDLAQQELQRRDSARRATRRAGVSDEEASLRRRGGRWDHHILGSESFDDDAFRRQMQITHQSVTSNQQTPQADDRSNVHKLGPPVSDYKYPAVTSSRPVNFQNSFDQIPSRPIDQPSRPPKQPLIPAKLPEPDVLLERDTPRIPQKVPLNRPPNESTITPNFSLPQPRVPHIPPKQPINVPAVPRKERLAFKPGAYLENGDPIRPVFIPSKLRHEFLSIASKNTRAGLEMCGVLCGTPVNNAIFVRCLLIPDQICTSDTCETQNESAMFDYCISEDLMVIGWIHTHPTQTCFMSSRDLHTHAGYQVMMPESIAIVCAPNFSPAYGIFRLTHPPGLDHILDCSRTETFHPHSIDNLYREAEHPDGHVYESDKMPFYVHDLRGIKA